MPLGYNQTQSGSGAYTPPGGTSAGYQNYSQLIPYYSGRSRIASIPEYQRSPFALGNDLAVRIQEGRMNMMKVLFNYVSKNGVITKPDVKYRWKVEHVPTLRFYLKKSQAFTATGNVTTFHLNQVSATRLAPNYAAKKVSGDIAKLQVGDYLLLMFSWQVKGRTDTPVYLESYAQPIPEIAKVTEVNYAAGTFKVERNWAGAQRTDAKPAAPKTITVIDNGASKVGHTVADTDVYIEEKDAFFVRLPNSMPEDEIDARVSGYTSTWAEGLMQRSLRAWGSGHFAEVLSNNLGNPSPKAKNRKEAIEGFYSDIEWASLLGEKAEGWDEEDNWWGLTDGLLTNIPKGHYVGLVPPDYAAMISGTEATRLQAMGSFTIPFLNKILENKAYFGSQNKVLLTGAAFHTAFSTMINGMTQNIPEIKTSWEVNGHSFTSSNGAKIDVIPSDFLTLNGLGNKAIMFDPQFFNMVNLAGYPIDIVEEVNNENPLKQNGFIHGVYSFQNTNPDAHWVFTLDNALSRTADVLGKSID